VSWPAVLVGCEGANGGLSLALRAGGSGETIQRSGGLSAFSWEFWDAAVERAHCRPWGSRAWWILDEVTVDGTKVGSFGGAKGSVAGENKIAGSSGNWRAERGPGGSRTKIGKEDTGGGATRRRREAEAKAAGGRHAEAGGKGAAGGRLIGLEGRGKAEGGTEAPAQGGRPKHRGEAARGLATDPDGRGGCGLADGRRQRPDYKNVHLRGGAPKGIGCVG